MLLPREQTSLSKSYDSNIRPYILRVTSITRLLVPGPYSIATIDLA
jgi:hypothetical protein